MKKILTIAAVAAFATLAACSEKVTETVDVPADEAAAATSAAIELNDDGSVKTPEDAASEAAK